MQSLNGVLDECQQLLRKKHKGRFVAHRVVSGLAVSRNLRKGL
jgi:hypothetical protein